MGEVVFDTLDEVRHFQMPLSAAALQSIVCFGKCREFFHIGYFIVMQTGSSGIEGEMGLDRCLPRTDEETGPGI